MRKALGDSVGTPRYLETLPGKGYRFLGEVGVEEIRPQVPVIRPAQETRSLPARVEQAGPLV